MRSRLSVLVAALLGLGISTAGQGQGRVFTARRDVVRLDVPVSQGGKPVLGLKPEDFRIKDDGVRQGQEFLSFDEVPRNVMLACDVSSSMAGDRLNDLRAAGHAVIDQLRQEDRGALISFSHAGSLRKDLTSDPASAPNTPSSPVAPRRCPPVAHRLR